DGGPVSADERRRVRKGRAVPVFPATPCASSITKRPVGCSESDPAGRARTLHHVTRQGLYRDRGTDPGTGAALFAACCRESAVSQGREGGAGARRKAHDE